MEATFKGNPVRLSGELPAKGTKAPAFTLQVKISMTFHSKIYAESALC